MRAQHYLYEDPTGGGDDAILELPETWRPPRVITVLDAEGFGHDMYLNAEVDE